MLDLRLDAAKKQFFDRAKVLRAMDRAQHRALSKAGAYVRQRARTSIRRPRQASLADLSPEQRAAYERAVLLAARRGLPRPKRPLAASRPGEPPRTPTGILKRSIVFVYDGARKTVLIGPYALNKGTGAPRTLEYGGTTRIERGDGSRTVTIAPRPYMRPALAAEIAAGKIRDAFRDTVRG
jgi:hypothetical protein